MANKNIYKGKLSNNGKKIGTINRCGKDKYILKEVKYINKRTHDIVGFHECWHKWMPSRNAWTKTPSYYVGA